MLRVRAEGPMVYTWVHTYEGPGCKGPQFVGAMGNPALLPAHTPKGMLGGRSSPDPNVIEVAIPAKSTTLLFTQMGPFGDETVSGCSLAVTFKAEEARQYEVGYSFDSDQCYADVNRLDQVGASVLRTPIQDAAKQPGRCKPHGL